MGARPLDRDAVDQRVIRQVELLCEKHAGGYPPLSVNRATYEDPPNADTIDPQSGYTLRELHLHRLAAALER